MAGAWPRAEHLPCMCLESIPSTDSSAGMVGFRAYGKKSCKCNVHSRGLPHRSPESRNVSLTKPYKWSVLTRLLLPDDQTCSEGFT